MKNKHVESFREFNENLNISDVRSSKSHNVQNDNSRFYCHYEDLKKV